MARWSSARDGSRIKRFVLIALAVLIFLGLAGAGYVFGVNAYVKRSAQPRIRTPETAGHDYDCVLVLGCGLDGDKPSPMLRDRVETAVALYKSGVSKKLLMSGDHGRVEHDEVNAMKDLAISLGVPGRDVFMDHAGFSTYDSMYRAKYIFGAEKVLIVTQEYHLYRAIYIASHLGLDADGVDGQIVAYDDYTNLYNTVREILARNKDFLKVIVRPKSKYTGERIDIRGNGDVTNDRPKEVPSNA